MTKSITILKSDFSKQGGAEKYARCLAQAFHKEQTHVTVLTTDSTDKKFPFEVISSPLKSKTSVGKILEFDKFCQSYCKSHPTDIIFGLDRNSFQTHLRAGSGVHRAFLEHRSLTEPQWKKWRHGINPLHKVLLHIEKKSFENETLQVLFTNSYLVKEEILSFYDVDPKKITVIHNGVEWHKMQESFDRFEENYDPGRFHFLFLGSNFARKGLHRLLHGLSLLTSDFHLNVVGYDKDEKKFQQLAKKLHLQKKVTFCGPQQNIYPYLQKSDCLVIPSFYDPFANVTVEALAMGLFVVSSKMNGGAEILTSETGTIIENLQDDAAVKEALETALNHPKIKQRAQSIRSSVQYLDFSTQLNTYLEKCS